MITNWNELPVGKFIEIYDMTDDNDKALRIAAALAGITYEEILNAPLAKTKALLKNAEFLSKQPKLKRAKREYLINGKKYCFAIDLNLISTAQYIDYSEMPKDLYHLPEIGAIFLIPSGHTYNDGYDMDTVIGDIRDHMPYEDFNSIMGFFLGSFLISMRRFEKETLKTLKKAVKEGTATREQLKEAKNNLQIIRAATIGFF